MTLISRLDRLLQPAVLLWLPVAGFGLVVLYLAVETVRPGTVVEAPFETTSEAIAGENPARALELMAAGANIDAVARVRAGLLDVRPLDLTPLETAIVSRRLEAVELLLESGADPSRSPRALCLAQLRLPEALPLLGAAGFESDHVAVLADAVDQCSRSPQADATGGRRQGTPFASRLDVR